MEALKVPSETVEQLSRTGLFEQCGAALSQQSLFEKRSLALLLDCRRMQILRWMCLAKNSFVYV